MKISNLSQSEKRALVAQYESAIRKLEFQLEKTQETLNELQASLPGSTGSTAKPKRRRGRPPKSKTKAKASARRRGRPPKAKSETAEKPKKRRGRPPKAKSKTAETASKTKRKRGRPKKSTTTQPKAKSPATGYRLSDWDQFVLDAVSSSKKPLLTSDLRDLANKQRKLIRGMSDAKIKSKIASVLHKLANKHKTLKKVPYEGRGYAYTKA